jgi:nicotinate dehydrogenase subunit B
MSHPPFEIEPERYELSEPPRYSFELERRDFLRVIGAGLVVVVTVPRGSAGQETGATSQSRSGSDVAAWLHIDERGQVTAYTGKVEIGQNIRTSLAQAIADELRLPLDAISMVMADTDRTPYDAGTFGSQSTPRMARQLARASATAREMLIDQAAVRWQIDRMTLSARDGRVVAEDGRSMGYGELTRGQRLTGTVVDDAAISPVDKWTLRGTAQNKVNGRLFVTGGHRFVPDLVRPGMLHGRIVRPDRIGATLVSVDDSGARAIAGVTVVRDNDFVGVVAPNERAAARAAGTIRAEWRAHPNPPSSDSIYEHLKRTGSSGGRGAAPVVIGDVARARAGAARTFNASYRIPYIAHVPLEPRAAVAEWTADRLTVWTGTQRPFGVRAELASALRISEDRVRVIVPDMGSGYGGKHSGEVAIEAARLAKAVGRPVKLVWTRSEEFTWAYFRPAGVIEVQSAVDDDARLVAWEFNNWNSGTAAIRTPYEIPHQRITFHSSDSPLRQGSYRGLAATANHYAREMHMDEVARALGVDAVEFRLRHLKDERMRGVLTAAATKASWPKPSAPGPPLRVFQRSGVEAPGRALGIACGTEKGSYVATAAELSKTSDGFRVERLIVAFECGAIVNPDGLQNQVEGAIVQGLGGALFETIEFRDGIILNGTMARYRVPRFKDVPPIEIVLLDRKDLPSAGAGETPIVCVAPAIGSAARQFGQVATVLPVKLT